MHDVFSFDVIIQRDQEEARLSIDQHLVIKSIMPFSEAL
jgi:hypothetical protein